MDESFNVTVKNEHIQEINLYLKKTKINETGGILIGYYSEDFKTAHITMVTGPPKDSKSGPTWFHRGTKGLKKLLLKKWEYQEFYIGEWHFHPDGPVEPSPQDIKQMIEISVSRRYNCPEPLMIIVAGKASKFMLQPYILINGKECLPLVPRIDIVDGEIS
jgi:integrative and conjugative element protein (TIGR02256 family)